jgi:folate-binding protein YgfZ
MPTCVVLEDRGVLALSGEDRVTFLQGLVSNDVRKAAPDRALFAALLTPQGKYLHDFCLLATNDALLLDAEGPRMPDLMRRLKLYKLRSKVALKDASADHAVATVFGDGALEALGLPADAGAARPLGGGVAFVDPRLPELGARLLLPRDEVDAAIDRLGLERAGFAAYDRHRLALGVPDGSRDLPVEKAILLENDYDELNAIAWDKGCYMGQELTARTKYRGLVKKRLVPVAVDGPLPPAGTPILRNGREVGELRSGLDGRALALVRLDAMEATDLVAGEARIAPHKSPVLGRAETSG